MGIPSERVLLLLSGGEGNGEEGVYLIAEGVWGERVSNIWVTYFIFDVRPICNKSKLEVDLEILFDFGELSMLNKVQRVEGENEREGEREREMGVRSEEKGFF